jgi:hypothetical protein
MENGSALQNGEFSEGGSSVAAICPRLGWLFQESKFYTLLLFVGPSCGDLNAQTHDGTPPSLCYETWQASTRRLQDNALTFVKLASRATLHSICAT